MKNLFQNDLTNSEQELVETLLERESVHVERIVSEGQATPAGEWIVDPRDEWVVLLTGSAALRFEGEKEERPMRPGDYLLIPGGVRHRVERTSETEQSIWLALFIGVPTSSP